MEIEQFKFASDNLGYLVHHQGQGIVIDGGDPQGIAEFASKNGISITCITNTHSHADHTVGNASLAERLNLDVLDCQRLCEGQTIALGGGQSLEVMLTPGHTTDSVCFKGEGLVVTGDTLFNGTVGNCFSGDLKGFYRSLKQLLALPETTLVYAGHDYVKESLTYARIIEPDNSQLEAYGAKYDPHHVVSSLGDELTVNPYLRFNAPSMIRRLEEKNYPEKPNSSAFHPLWNYTDLLYPLIFSQ